MHLYICNKYKITITYTFYIVSNKAIHLKTNTFLIFYGIIFPDNFKPLKINIFEKHLILLF